MIISLNLLNEFIPIKNIPLNKFISDLFNMGIEVDKIETFEKSKDFIVGYVKECIKHPRSEKLSLCKVQINKNKTLQIICGASNVGVDQKVIVALPGAKLPNTEIIISKRNILGIDSFGMICSLKEINFPIKFIPEDEKDSIYVFNKNDDIKVGDNAIKLLSLDDTFLHLSFTSNRFDLNGINNLINEIATYYDYELKPIQYIDIEKNAKVKNNVTIHNNANETIAYCYLIINDWKNMNSHPYIKNYLFKNNIRSHNAIVDLTNYIMLELNQPLHAYDLDYVGNDLTVQHCRSNKKFELLSGEIMPINGYVTISNKKEPLCLAGITGLKNSSINTNTQNILLESAIWDPIYIRKATSKSSILTQASTIYSRVLPIQSAKDALERFIYLAKKYNYIDKYSNIKFLKYRNISDKVIFVEKNDLLKITKDLNWNSFIKIIARVFKYERNKSLNSINVFIPPKRLDIDSKNSLIELALRIYGINNIKSKKMHVLLKTNNENILSKKISIVEKYLISIGFNNVKTYNLIQNNDISSKESLFFVKNTVSDEFANYKSNNFTSLLNVLNKNLSFSNIEEEQLFYEVFNYYLKENKKITKTKVLSLIFLNSTIFDINDKNNNRNLSSLSDILEKICLIFNFNIFKIDFKKYVHSGLNKYNSYGIYINNKFCGFLGQVDFKLINSENKKDKAYYLEVSLEELLNKNKNFSILSINKNSLVKKDISFIFPIYKSINLFKIMLDVYECSSLLYSVKVFDYYKDFANKTISIGIRFFIDPTHNLNKDDIHLLFKDIIKKISNKYKCRIIETNLFKN